MRLIKANTPTVDSFITAMRKVSNIPSFTMVYAEGLLLSLALGHTLCSILHSIIFGISPLPHIWLSPLCRYAKEG